MDHVTLVLRARHWLRNSLGCRVVISEPGGDCWERPDAIGWHYQGRLSVLVECKASRSDFLRDQKKACRATKYGLGRKRYYLTPPKLVRVEEVPEGWGLLECFPHCIRKQKESAEFSLKEGRRAVMSEMALLYSMAALVQRDWLWPMDTKWHEGPCPTI